MDAIKAAGQGRQQQVRVQQCLAHHAIDPKHNQQNCRNNSSQSSRQMGRGRPVHSAPTNSLFP